MRVYVLSAGRSGEKTLASACSFMTNYTFGSDVDRGENHIACDKHLVWTADKLDDSAMYVHLIGERSHTANAYSRFGFDELTVSRWAPTLNDTISVVPGESGLDACLQYVDAVDEKIRSTITSRAHHMTITTSTIADDFATMWHGIDASGELDSALEIFRLNHDLADYLPLLSEPEDLEVDAQENPA